MRTLVAFALLPLLAACDTGTSDDTADASTGGADETSSTVPTTGGDAAPTFTEVQAEVLNAATCSCHFAAPNTAANGNLELSTAVAYANIFNVPSGQVADKNYITPNDPDNSYIYMKVTGAAGIMNSMMPLGGMLTADQTDLLRAWIEAGAPND